MTKATCNQSCVSIWQLFPAKLGLQKKRPSLHRAPFRHSTGHFISCSDVEANDSFSFSVGTRPVARVADTVSMAGSACIGYEVVQAHSDP